MNTRFRRFAQVIALCRYFVFAFLSSAAFGRRHVYPVFAVGREYTMDPDQIHPGLWHQRRQLGNEIQRLEDDVSERRPVPPSL